MTETTQDHALRSVARLLAELVGEAWDQDVELTADMSLLYDLDLESIELVVLANRLHERYPGLGLLDVLKEGAVPDTAELTVGNLVDLVVAAERAEQGSAKPEE